MNNTIYELREYNCLYDDTFYYHFKNDDTVVARIKTLLREQLRYEAFFRDENTKNNIRAIHLLKAVRDIYSLIEVLKITGYDLKEKELL